MRKLNKINENQKTPIVLAILLMVIGVIDISLPLFRIINLRMTLIMSFGLIALFNLVSFIMTYKDRDTESILTFIVSLVIMLMACFMDITKHVNVALILIIWVAFISLIRLKKADYYDDRKNKAWIIQLVSLAIFVLTGLLTAVNLYYANNIKILLFGYFFLINGILELIDPLILALGKLNENRK